MLSRTFALVSVGLALQTLASPLTERALNVNCLPAGIEPSCYNLISACATGVTTQTTSQLWHNRNCVTAATCYGVGKLEDTISCQLNTAVTNAQQISLDYNIYAGIVGSCAWAPNGCPITEQNYIDFYYGSLSLINSGAYPSSSNTVIAWWQAVEAWTATGNTVPYSNFNDWLLYSTYSTSPGTSTPPPTTPTATPSSSSSSVTQTPTATPSSSSSSVAPTTTA